MPLKNKVLIITGSANGFGAALSRRVVREGAKAVLGDIDQKGGEAIEVELNNNNKKNVKFVICDVQKRADLIKLFETAEKEFGGVDILINNAGISRIPDLYDGSETWKQIISVNLNGVIEGTQLSFPYFKKRGGGVIVNVASMAGIQPYYVGLFPAYGASKAGVIAFTRALHGLKQTANIRVNAVAPIFSDTKLLREGLEASKMFRQQVESAGTVTVEEVVTAIVHCIENESLVGEVVAVTPRNQLFVVPKEKGKF
ncbi:8721_t:CDS:2 [Ambispora gerdemannii]|uniref:8721_t:CDS:1 n=1 Tax=Ambispora gerdemannii TaxID=144530 RepID=A0A9N9AGX7_9GLOM|nr:8721_t:CDS:2 [Ambispora gerdemannii]